MEGAGAVRRRGGGGDREAPTLPQGLHGHLLRYLVNEKASKINIKKSKTGDNEKKSDLEASDS